MRVQVIDNNVLPAEAAEITNVNNSTTCIMAAAAIPNLATIPVPKQEAVPNNNNMMSALAAEQAVAMRKLDDRRIT